MMLISISRVNSTQSSKKTASVSIEVRKEKPPSDGTGSFVENDAG